MTLGLLAAALAMQGIGQDDQQSKRQLFGYLMDYTTVLTGDRGNVMEKDVVVAFTKPQWDKLRVKLGISDEKEAELEKLHGPLGAIDWGREQVVFARTGSKPTGGYTASVYKLSQTSRSDTWKIELLVTPPKAGSMNIEMITYPYVVFRMRRAHDQPSLVVREAKKT